MRKFLLPTAVLVALAPLVSLGQDKMENPYKNAKVGDYTTYKMTTGLGGKDIEITMKKIVSAKDDKEVTLKITTSFGGKEIPAQEQKIDLTKPLDLASLAGQGMKKQQGTFEKTGEGKEKIKIGDKSYDCNWTAGKATIDAQGQKLETEVKVWTSKSVPLDGIVKMETKANIFNMQVNSQMELTGSGNEK